jgi:hypothetical protein
MSQRILIALLASGTITALSAMDVAACRGKHLGAAEHARNEREIWAERRAVQAQNISAIDKTLGTTELSASDRSEANALRDRAANLNKTGKLDEADRALLKAWKTLGHPELYRAVARVKC